MKQPERIEGFDQSPDFIIRSDLNSQEFIKSKVAEDDGTAQAKVARIPHLDCIRQEGMETDDLKFRGNLFSNNCKHITY